MKTINSNMNRRRCAITLLIVCLVLTVPAFGGDYDLSWSTIDGGGGTSSGGDFTLRGTIGQPEAGVMGGGDYELSGGFWPGGPLCTVNFHHFAKFAEYWLEAGTGLDADLYEDGFVDLLDLELFVYEWLYYCPYDWPLR